MRYSNKLTLTDINDHFLNLQDDSDALKKRMQEVGDSLASIEQELAAVKSETNDSFSRVSTDVDNTGTRDRRPHSPFHPKCMILLRLSLGKWF